ncbi:MAG: radical SAM protein [Deltaproteobacteria bacterium]|nr:radical SAM protein [Deltaproteobacteria bacterium]
MPDKKNKKESISNNNNVTRRTFLDVAGRSAMAAGFFLTAPGLLVACKKKGSGIGLAPVMSSLASSAVMSGGIEFYNRIRESKASSPLYVTFDLQPFEMLNSLAGDNSADLTSSQIADVIRQLGEADVLNLTLLGPAPFKDAGIMNYIKLAKDNDISLSVVSSGDDINEQQMDALAKIKFFSLKFNLDGISAATHDKLHKAGNFDKTLAAIRAGIKRGINTTVITYANALNVGEVEQIMDLSIREKADNFVLRRLVPMDTSDKTKALVISPADGEKLISILSKKIEKSQGGTNMIGADPFGGDTEYFIKSGVMDQRANQYAWNTMCQSGATYCHITSKGAVLPCTWLPVPAGNLKEKSFAEIWEKGETFRQLRGRQSFDECIAHSFTETGNMLERDPLAWT